MVAHGYLDGRKSQPSGLAGEVDGAVVLGGAVEAAFTGSGPSHFGMDGIVGNALGFDRPPTPEELVARFPEFSLRPLLDQDSNAPMLVINGADDVHVPQHDTLVFQGRRDTVVELLPDTGHCAVTKLPEVFSTIAGWHPARSPLPKSLGDTHGDPELRHLDDCRVIRVAGH